MTRRLWLYGVNAILGLGCLALIAAPARMPVDVPIAAGATRPRPAVTTPPSAPVAPNVPAGNPFRPAAAPVVVEAAPAAPSKPNLRLVGIIDGPGKTVAVIQSTESQSLIRARIGDKVAPWTLAEINRKSIVLEGNGVRSTLLLDAPVSVEMQAKEKAAAAAAQASTPVGQAFSINPSSIIQRIKR